MNDYLQTSRRYKGFHYKAMQPEMFEYLHLRSFEMLKEIKKIFSRNGIQYMICGGTLLGAITTGHFIPWDDDVDVCIFEQDYEKAKRCLLNELPEDMVLQCIETEKRYYHGWMKVRDRRSRTYPGEKIYKENGVWIDLYMVVTLKEREISLKQTLEHIAYLRRRLRAGGIAKKEYRKRIKENKLIKRMMSGWMERMTGKDKKKVNYICSAAGITLDADWCFPLREYLFEGVKFTSFSGGEQYLEEHYGKRYEDLPPEDMRRISINRVEVLD